MSDNAAYRLRLAAEAARAKADVSVDPSDHMVANALEGVIGAEQYRLQREVHLQPDPSSFPPWSTVSQPGTYSWPGEFEGIEIDPRLEPNV